MKGLINDTSNQTQVFWIGLGKLSSFALAFVSAAILSRYLTKEDYGTYKQVMYIYSAFVLIFTVGLPETLTYFLPKLTKSEGKHLVNRFELTFVLLGLIFSIFIYLSAGVVADILNNPALEKALRIYAPVPLLLMPTFSIESVYLREQKTHYLAMYTVFSRIVVLLSIILPVILYKADCETALYGLVLSSFLMLLAALFLIYRPYRGYRAEPSSLRLRDIAAYAIPLMGADLCIMLSGSADQFFVSRYFGEVTFAEFANGYMQFPLAPMITASVMAVLIPLFSRANTPQLFGEAIGSWQKAILKTSLILYPLLVYCLFFATEIIIIIYGKEYNSSAIYFQIALISNFVNIYPFLPVLLALKKMKIYVGFYLISAISIWLTEAVTIALFPSPVVIACVSAANSILLYVAFYSYIRYRLHLHVFTQKTVLSLLKIIVHALLIILPIRILLYPYIETLPLVLNQAITFCLYYPVILLTGKWLGLDYKSILSPIIRSLLKQKE
ncbi:O-antigen/teichoic acid export membrane protein [Parabacteroides sp. PFB2-12]|uniref:oligosaccharide flippase family protein n=1 Tax=unclassified Parabacteroides TaxID=2649774 RepID=UPI002475B8D1|nr:MULTISPECIES: oligosaccharide flippase family protein [unclassified Parabacteroides]MDH6342491.1 O-antigen/teichoic acid export membrane protein [Parabacteroides sp. PM6-13]MDH6390143.1 O-antigen/teichoic acid export membrane protein [Parabacteroides sp. PFB2-12]MDL2310097.1 oligosaccharide flippase family protein [Parabacteroides sp. OttesenSCG-928-B22]